MNNIAEEFNNLIDTVRILRSEVGCPWDRRQTTESLKNYLREECEEILMAINNGDAANLAEELGDFLYLIVMISRINQENGTFTLSDVIDGITNKLVRRHPHVFSGVIIHDEEELRQQWNKIKTAEKKKKQID